MSALRHSSRPAAAASLLAVVAALTCACGADTQPAASTASGAGGAHAGELSGAPLPAAIAHDFALADIDGRVADSREYRGRVVVLAFIDSRCGAPCLVVADQIRGALDQLATPVAVLFVTIDPAADTRASVARFLARASLTARVRYLVGPRSSLRALWRAYDVPAPAAGGAVFERFAPVLLLDSDGRARVEYALEQLTPEGLVHDIRALSR